MWRVAVIGAGRMGRRHAAAWTSLAPRARVVAVVGRAEWASLAAITQDCDVVDVCLPTPLHAEVTAAALAAGRHVLVEKPMARSLAGADRMIDAAAGSPGRLMVAHVVRFFPQYRRLLSLPAVLGDPAGAQAYRFTAREPGVRWLADVAQSGGALVDLLVHDYDILNALLGAPGSVVASEDPSGTASVVVNYPAGRVGVAVGSMSMPVGYRFRAGVQVAFEGGVAEALPSGAVRVTEAAKVTEERVQPADPYVEQLRYLLDCLDSGTPPAQGTAQQARAALDVALAARRYADRYRPSPLPG